MSNCQTDIPISAQDCKCRNPGEPFRGIFLGLRGDKFGSFSFGNPIQTGLTNHHPAAINEISKRLAALDVRPSGYLNKLG